MSEQLQDYTFDLSTVVFEISREGQKGWDESSLEQVKRVIKSNHKPDPLVEHILINEMVHQKTLLPGATKGVFYRAFLLEPLEECIGCTNCAAGVELKEAA